MESILTRQLWKTLVISVLALPIIISGCQKGSSIAPPVPSLDQSAALTNDVEITYSATLVNVSSAMLTVNKNGVMFLSQNIFNNTTNGGVINKTFTFATDKITKGSYDFILTSGNLQKKSSVTIPNYKPTINLTTVNVNVSPYATAKVLLPTPIDKNPEDTAKITNAISQDSKTQITLIGGNLSIHPEKPSGTYNIEIDFGSITGGTDKATLTGLVITDSRIEVYPFTQPNDSTLNWYGSGDVNNDNVVDAKDATMLAQILNNSYSNPNDPRLLDRSDVNGDGVVDSLDYKLLQQKLNGTIAYMPGEWNKLTTRNERVDWVTKMLAIDKIYAINFPGQGISCRTYKDQTLIDFRGFSQTDLQKFLSVYSYDITNNGRFNLPILEVMTTENDATPPYSHGWNTIIVGDDASVWGNLCNIEPQIKGAVDVQPGQFYFHGVNTTFAVRGPPIGLEENGITLISTQDYIAFDIKNYIPTVNPYQDPLINFISHR